MGCDRGRQSKGSADSMRQFWSFRRKDTWRDRVRGLEFVAMTQFEGKTILAGACVVLAVSVASEMAVAEEARLPLAGAYGDLAGCRPEFSGENEGFSLTADGFVATEWGCTFRAIGTKSRSWRIESDCAIEGTEFNETVVVVEDRPTSVATVVIGEDILIGDLCSLPQRERESRDRQRRAE